jgi:hypothetical protein
MLQKSFVAFVFGTFAVLLAEDIVAVPAIRQPRSAHLEVSKRRKQSQAAVTNRSKQAGRTPSKLSDGRISSEPIVKDHGSSETVNRRLAQKVSRVLDNYYTRPFNTRDDAPWSVLHWSIAYGVDAQVSQGGPNGQRVTAIGWLCCNLPSAGKRLVSQRASGLSLPIAPGIQGHHGQFLSMLAQSRVPSDYVFRVGNDELQIADLVDYEKNTCRSGMELTFKLTGISHYTLSNELWKNGRGETWSVERLLKEELEQPINRMEACCGGAHRLFALSYAVDRRRKEEMPITGPWKVADRRIQAYQRKAFEMQNKDGGFSTMWLERLENRSDKNRKLITSGHLLEWLAFSLPKDRLHEPKFERAVAFVVNLLERNQSFDWHEGGLGHALHALAIYEQRVLGIPPGQRIQLLGQNRVGASFQR